MPVAKPFVGYHCDIARGAYLRPEAFKQTMAWAAGAGFTHFVPYLENMIRLPAMERACPACAYDAATWRDFEASARQLGIDLVAHFNVIGHTAAICGAYPELAGESHGHEMDVTSRAARDWVCQCLDEHCAFATSEWFLLGGDEWLPPDHLLRQPAFNVAQAWAGQVNLGIEVLRRHDRRPIVWHDMLVHYPEAMELLSREAVVAFWYYDEAADFPVIRMLKERGFAVIVAAGLCAGSFSERRVKATRQCIDAVRRHGADGFLMTSWEHQRYEQQQAIIALTGRLWRGEELPAPLIETFSIEETLSRFDRHVPALTPWRERCRVLLDDPAWDDYPECRTVLRAWLEGDVRADLDSFARYHYPEGPLFEHLRQRRHCAPPAEPPGVILSIAESEPAGASLTVVNGDERFVIYPRYGASLQDWSMAGRTIVPHSLPRFLANGPRPGGGYRSYNGVGGFRPIWALGTHHNPCIIWQRDWNWRLLADEPGRKVVELSQTFPHVAITYMLTVVDGTPGFTLDLEATNLLDQAFGTFNWNLALDFAPRQLPDAVFRWSEGGESRQYAMRDHCASAFMLTAREGLTYANGDWELAIETQPGTTHGYFVDWSAVYITPDHHGIFQPLTKGETYRTQWRFTPRR